MLREIVKLLADCEPNPANSLLRGRDPHAYVEKLLKHADLLTWHHSGNLHALVAFYANDPRSKLAFITMVAISPEYQGKGAAKSLLTSCLSIIATRGFHKCRLEVSAGNERAIRLYLSLGFVEICRNDQTLIFEATLGAADPAPME